MSAEKKERQRRINEMIGRVDAYREKMDNRDGFYKADLSPLTSLVDSETGSNLGRYYNRPKTDEEVEKEQMNQYMNLLNMNAKSSNSSDRLAAVMLAERGKNRRAKLLEEGRDGRQNNKFSHTNNRDTVLHNNKTEFANTVNGLQLGRDSSKANLNRESDLIRDKRKHGYNVEMSNLNHGQQIERGEISDDRRHGQRVELNNLDHDQAVEREGTKYKYLEHNRKAKENHDLNLTGVRYNNQVNRDGARYEHEKFMGDTRHAQRKETIEMITKRKQAERKLKDDQLKADLKHLPKDKRDFISKLSKTNAAKSSIRNQIMSDYSRAQQASDEDVKIAIYKNMLKTMNSTEGPDALSDPEYQRLASLLEFKKGNFTGEGSFFGRDIDKFEEFIKNKHASISNSIKLNNAEIEKAKGGNGENDQAAKIQLFMKKNGITDTAEALRILKEKGKI